MTDNLRASLAKIHEVAEGTAHALSERMPILLALAPQDRPRERLLAKGPGSLSDAELLAVLLGSGRRGKNVVEVAQELLDHAGDLRQLVANAEADLCAISGIGPARSASVQAALELGRRVLGRRPDRGRRFANSADVWTHFRAQLGASPIEEFWMLALDVRHRVLFQTCVARGSLTGVEVHPREIFRPLIRSSAASVILATTTPLATPRLRARISI